MSNQTSIPSRCIFPHAGPGPPVLNILPFSPSSSSDDLLQLLGESKDSLQQLICSGHPYLFNLGGGKYLPPSDCDKVADVLLERNLPKVHNNTQRETCFVPETFLPTIPLAVDTEAELGGRLSSLSVEDKKKLGVNGCLKTQVAGDRLEERLYKALKAHPENLGLVIQGGCMRSPGATSRGEHSEHDFLIVNPRLKYILAIECKRNHRRLRASFRKKFTQRSSGRRAWVGKKTRLVKVVSLQLCSGRAPRLRSCSTQICNLLFSLDPGVSGRLCA